MNREACALLFKQNKPKPQKYDFKFNKNILMYGEKAYICFADINKLKVN